MLTVFNPKSFRGKKASAYHARRLVYQATIAKSMGYDVELHLPSGDFDCSPIPPDLRALASKMTITDGTKPCGLPADAIYFCTSTYIHYAGNYLPARPKVVVWNDTLACQHADRLFPRADLVLAWVTKASDFTEPTTKKHPSIMTFCWPKEGQPVLSVPFVSHDIALEAFWEDGVTDAYLRDDLEAIRAKYGSPEKKRLAGFVGGSLPVRSRAKSTLGSPAYEIVWAGGHHPLMPVRDVLRWTSECRACLHLPGDTWKCSRMMDAVMMGVPLLQLRDMIDVVPPLTDKNAILVDDWADEAALMAGLDRCGEIVVNADRAYREGWSLRAQLTQVFQRLGIET